MLFIVVLITGYITVRALPTLLAEVIATLIGISLVISSRRAARAFVGHGSGHSRAAADWDRSPTTRERKMLRDGLKATIDSVQFTSLMPCQMLRAHRIVAFWRRLYQTRSADRAR